MQCIITGKTRECSGSVVECLTCGARGLSLTGISALCPWVRHIYPSLVLVQPRKTCPYITEGLLMGHKESNETKQGKQINKSYLAVMRQRQCLVTFTKVLLRAFFLAWNCNYFLIHKFKHMFWVPKRTISLKWDGSFKYPQHMFWLRNKKINFQVGILIWVPAFRKSELYKKPSLSHCGSIYYQPTDKSLTTG